MFRVSARPGGTSEDGGEGRRGVAGVGSPSRGRLPVEGWTPTARGGRPGSATGIETPSTVEATRAREDTHVPCRRTLCAGAP